MRPAWLWPVVALATSIAITATLWLVGIPGAFLFLLFPFFLFGKGRRVAAPPQRCPTCGTVAAPRDRYCAQDGTRLSQ